MADNRCCHHDNREGLVRQAAAQLPIAVFGHPVGASEMGVVYAACALGIGFGADSEKNFNGFLPLCAVRFSVQKPHIELDVLAVVLGESRAAGSVIQKVECAHREVRRLLSQRNCVVNITTM